MFLRHRRGLLALAVLALAAGDACAQRPLILRSTLTRDDPFDRVRTKSHCQVHEVTLEGGRAYLIDLASGDLDPYLRVEDGAGKVLAENDDIGPKNLNARVGLVAPRGPVRLVVTSYRAGETGAYALRALPLEPVDLPRTYVGKLARDTPRFEGRPHDWYRLHAEPGLVYWVELESRDFTPRLLTLAVGDQVAAAAEGAPARTLLLSLGRHPFKLVASAARPDGAGEYMLTVRPYTLVAPPSTDPTMPKDIPFPEGPPTLITGTLSPDDPPERGPKGSPHKVHKVRFDAGKAYLIDLRSGEFDTLLRVEDLAGKELASNDNDGSELNSRLVFEPARAGEYRLVVTRPPRAVNAGTYELTLQRFADGGRARQRVALERDGRVLTARGLTYYHRGDIMTAGDYLEEALEWRRSLFPPERYPDGHRTVGESLMHYGMAFQRRGALAHAEVHYRAALGMGYKLYPKDRFPAGHEYLAVAINHLARVLDERGEGATAEWLYHDSLAMRRRLYPEERHPKGHPLLATGLNNLAHILAWRGEHAEAEKFYREALAMTQRIYAPRSLDVAAAHDNLSRPLFARGALDEAERHAREALAIRRGAFPPERYPDGHPDLILSLSSVSGVLAARGKHDEAEPLAREAVATARRLFPAVDYPDGHPDLVTTLGNLGRVLQRRGLMAEAADCYARALTMRSRFAALFAEQASEAEGLNYLANSPPLRGDLLTVTTGLKDGAACYPAVWGDRAALSRTLEGRRRLLRGLDDGPTRERLAELLRVRHALASLILAPGVSEGGARGAQLRRLAQRKEDLEKALAASIPELARRAARAVATPEDLIKSLPAGAAFIDMYRRRGRGADEEAAYVAFVLRPGREVRRVEMGPAAPIEKALTRWRQDIAAGRDSLAGAALRGLIWDKLEPHLGKDVGTVYLAGDGPLHGLPWAALPGRRRGTVLLEDHALATVPNGPFLLDRLRNPPREPGPGTLLAVGAVAYDAAALPEPSGRRDLELVGPEGVAVVRWGALPGTARELDAVTRLAGALRPPVRVLERRGAEAPPWRVLRELEGARWAHLATHGFFAAPDSRAARALLDEGLFTLGRGSERVSVGAQNPLTRSGLVLSGANLPAKSPEEDRGLLTAEAIAGLRLDGLRLAVLSACETGLGEVEASGEGVLGLVRAFHLGGARDVVASLWKVDDEATAALMAIFYHRLWEKGDAPLEALRQAQLALYRNPKDITALARQRGPDFAATVRRVSDPGAAAADRARARDWAAFVLSGPGR